LKIPRVIPRAGQQRDFPHGGRAQAPWATPCKPISGKPTVATVPPRSLVRLAAMGSGASLVREPRVPLPLRQSERGCPSRST